MQAESQIGRVESGVIGLDEMLHGGLPRGRIILVIGGPGSGKSMFCSQFLAHGISKGENGLYYFTDGKKDNLYQDMKTIGVDLSTLEQKGNLIFFEGSPLKDLPRGIKVGSYNLGKRELSVISMIDRIKESVKKNNAQRITVDSMSAFSLAYPDIQERRAVILRLIDILKSTNATCLITAEIKNVGLERQIELEEYLADGVIVLQTLKVGRVLLRTVLIEKMRGTAHESQVKPYMINNKGLSINAREGVLL